MLYIVLQIILLIFNLILLSILLQYLDFIVEKNPDTISVPV